MTSRIAYNNPDAIGALGLAYHYELLMDRRRLVPLRRAIQLVAKGRRVLESGAGSGVLSILAARAGASAVYAVEKDPAIARFLRQNVRAAGCEEIVHIIEKDSRSVTLSDLDGKAADVLIAEHLSTWQVTEPQISVMNHLNSNLAAKAAIRIPERAFNCVELTRSQYRCWDAVELRTHYFGFSGIRKPVALSAPALFARIDFSAINETAIDHDADVVATRDGIVNSLRLTSPLRVFDTISFRSSDSLMPPVVVPLERDLQVRAGDVVKVRLWFRCETSWYEVGCEARRVDVRGDVAGPWDDRDGRKQAWK